jgi:phospholipid/cholesterol/gamma-HCH transport system substrate-binding protein
LGTFSDTATALANNTQADLVTNLRNLEPTLKALADIGPRLDTILAYAPAFPLGQNAIDRAVRGDYLNLYAVVDLTVPRLKRTLFRGTRWGDANTNLVPAPGEPDYLQYTYDPLHAPLAPPPAPDAPPDATTPPAQAPAEAPPPPPGATTDAPAPNEPSAAPNSPAGGN